MDVLWKIHIGDLTRGVQSKRFVRGHNDVKGDVYPLAATWDDEDQACEVGAVLADLTGETVHVIPNTKEGLDYLYNCPESS